MGKFLVSDPGRLGPVRDQCLAVFSGSFCCIRHPTKASRASLPTTLLLQGEERNLWGLLLPLLLPFLNLNPRAQRVFAAVTIPDAVLVRGSGVLV